jgi:hypothetical protein
MTYIWDRTELQLIRASPFDCGPVAINLVSVADMVPQSFLVAANVDRKSA